MPCLNLKVPYFFLEKISGIKHKNTDMSLKMPLFISTVAISGSKFHLNTNSLNNKYHNDLIFVKKNLMFWLAKYRIV